jgi:hypothetical protein
MSLEIIIKICHVNKYKKILRFVIWTLKLKVDLIWNIN